MTIDLSIIVTNWNKSDLIPLQLRFIKLSLEECNRHMNKEIEVIIVDHFSNEPNRIMLKESLIHLKDIMIELNISYYQMWKNDSHIYLLPVNIGVKRAKGEFIMWLPSDMYPITGFHIHFNHHKNKEIFLKTKLITLPNYIYDFNTNCRTMGGGSCKTKYWHEIRGFHEFCVGQYCGGPNLVERLIKDTDITNAVCVDDAYTIHFGREIHPETIYPLLPNMGELQRKYVEIASKIPKEKVNPDGWGELDTLERIL